MAVVFIDFGKHQLEGIRSHLRRVVEWVLEDGDRVEDEGDNHRQRSNRQPVQPENLHPEEVGEGDRDHTPYHQYHPHYGRKALANLEQPQRSGLVQFSYLRQSLALERLFGSRAWPEVLDAAPELGRERLRVWARLSLRNLGDPSRSRTSLVNALVENDSQ
jgi:hypothetical protein